MIKINSHTRGIRKTSFVLLCGSALLTATLPAFAYSGEELEKTVKITLAEATAIALKARPGKITDQELEKESGGSGVRYSFDVLNGAGTYEVGVDAMTGKILDNSLEGINPD